MPGSPDPVLTLTLPQAVRLQDTHSGASLQTNNTHSGALLQMYDTHSGASRRMQIRPTLQIFQT